MNRPHKLGPWGGVKPPSPGYAPDALSLSYRSINLAVCTGFEPVISPVTGERPKPLGQQTILGGAGSVPLTIYTLTLVHTNIGAA